MPRAGSGWPCSAAIQTARRRADPDRLFRAELGGSRAELALSSRGTSIGGSRAVSMDANQLEEEAIFHAARRIGSREARDAYLLQVCGPDQARRGRLEGLLRVQDQEASFLEAAPF